MYNNHYKVSFAETTLSVTRRTPGQFNQLADSGCKLELTGCINELCMEVEGEERFCEVLAEVALHSTGNGLGIQLKLIVEVNLVQLPLLQRIPVQFVGLGQDAWSAVQSFFLQP